MLLNGGKVATAGGHLEGQAFAQVEASLLREAGLRPPEPRSLKEHVEARGLVPAREVFVPDAAAGESEAA